MHTSFMQLAESATTVRPDVSSPSQIGSSVRETKIIMLKKLKKMELDRS